MDVESVIENIFGIDHQLEEYEVTKLAQIGQLVGMEDGKTFIREGENARSFYLIVSGEVLIYAPLEEPKLKLHTATTNEMVGWSSLVPPRIYTGTAVAKGDCQLLRFDSDVLLGLMKKDFRLGYIVMSKVSQFLSQRLLESIFGIMADTIQLRNEA